jgi:hypothetical protein
MLLKKAVFKDGLRYRLDIDEVKRRERMFVAFSGEANFVRLSYIR